MSRPVVLQIDSLVNTDVDALAMALAAKQKEETGVAYAYCSVCTAAVSARAAKKSVEAGRPVLCRTHARKAVCEARVTDSRTYLCSVCRVPLEGDRKNRARSAAKNGHAATCGAEACRSTALTKRRQNDKPAVPCAVCGEPANKRDSAYARASGYVAYCDAHKRRERGVERKARTLLLSTEAIDALKRLASGGRSMSAAAEEAILEAARRRSDLVNAPPRTIECVSNAGYEASLQVGKVYAVRDDGEAEGAGLLRISDESGEDYLYPAANFAAPRRRS